MGQVDGDFAKLSNIKAIAPKSYPIGPIGKLVQAWRTAYERRRKIYPECMEEEWLDYMPAAASKDFETGLLNSRSLLAGPSRATYGTST